VNAQSYLPNRRLNSISLLPVLFASLPLSSLFAQSAGLHANVSKYIRAEDSNGEQIAPALSLGPWSWENPRPQGNNLGAVLVVAADNVWVGGSKTLMHWDGRYWQLTYSSPNSDSDFYVRQIWGSDAQNIWAVLGNELLQWRGGVWVNSGLPSTPLTDWGAVWGTGPNDVWTVSSSGVYHWDGQWSERTPDSWQSGLPTLWGISADDVTVVDGRLNHFRWNGRSWQAIEPPPADYQGGAGPGEPWFYNALERLFLRFRAGVWERYRSPTLYVSYHSVWSHASTEAWALGTDRHELTSFLHFDGEGWSIAQTVPHALLGIGGSAPDHVWAVGEKGAIVRFNGRYEERRAGSVADLNNIFGFSESELWAVGKSGTVLRRGATEWETIQVPSERNLMAINGVSPSDMWVVGENGTSLHFDGNTWSKVPTGTNRALLSVWASGPSDAWAGTEQPPFAPALFLHWDGTTWSRAEPTIAPGTVLGFWGFAPDDLWAVGSICDYFYPFNPRCIKTASHFDGSAWMVNFLGPPVYSIFEELVAIGGIDSRDVWALGHSTSYHWDGETWSQVEFPDIARCTGIWGRAKDDVFATCEVDVVHWDGSRWSVLPTLSGQPLAGLWGVDSKFWVVGLNGTILKYQGIDRQ
jgi:hypothetical protein